MDKEQNIKQVWQNQQYKFFEKDWEKKWKEKFLGEDGLKARILKLEYDNFYNVNNVFGKLNKALQICDFLYELKKSKPPQDTEKIIITMLVSIAEAVYRINKPNEEISENLVKGFFKPVKSKIDYKIRGHIDANMPYKKTFGAVDVLFLVRNDYIHNGNFTGIFFRNNNSEAYTYNIGTFYYSEKDNKTQSIDAISECNLNYEEFMKIFLEAFIESINKYCNKKTKSNKSQKIN